MEQKENRLSIGKVNGVEIFAVTDENNQTFVPIKPICQAIGVQHARQIQKLQEHPIYSSTVYSRYTVGADGKDREMVCIELEYVFGWILSIHPDNVSESARESLMTYQRECHHVLFVHFVNKARRQLEANMAEIRILQRLNDLHAHEKEVKSQIRDLNSELAKIRSSRLDDQPSLFD